MTATHRPRAIARARTPVAAGRTRTVRVALAGCGTVGASLVTLALRNREWCEQRHRVRFEFVRVLLRDPGKTRPAPLPPQRVTTDVDDFLRAEADIVVETIGGAEPAGRLVRAALARGRAVVTANKALIAAHGPALQQLANANETTLHFEAAVGGGVPVVRTLRDALAGHGVRTITGILNGTSNYLLTRLTEGACLADALADAQAKGFAEADPSRDLQGLDAADKIRILAWLAWNVDPARLRVDAEPLPADPAVLVRRAAARGGVLKYLAGAVRDDDASVRAWVRPVIVPGNHGFAQVRDEEVAVHIDSDSLGELRLQGRGAGGSATASAMLADMLAAVS